MFRLASTFVIALCFISCGRLPSSKEASQEFERRNPGTQVIKAVFQEGDGGHVYYTVHYTIPPSTDSHEAEIGFRSIDSKAFEIFYQKEITEQGAAANP